MQITNYSELVKYVRNNAVFTALNDSDDDADFEMQLFAQRAIVDFVLSDAQLFSIASKHHNETDASILHEFFFDDVA
jgi:hypothetical protein